VNVTGVRKRIFSDDTKVTRKQRRIDDKFKIRNILKSYVSNVQSNSGYLKNFERLRIIELRFLSTTLPDFWTSVTLLSVFSYQLIILQIEVLKTKYSRAALFLQKHSHLSLFVTTTNLRNDFIKQYNTEHL